MQKGKYRKIRGGLDRAVEQAEAKNLEDFFIVDVDCHIFEPFASFSKYLPDKWKKEYNDVRVLEEAERYKEDYLLFTGAKDGEKIDPVKLSLLKLYKEAVGSGPTKYFDFYQGGRIQRNEILFEGKGLSGDIYHKKWLRGMKTEEIVDTFITRMRDIGIKRSVIFPNMLLSIGTHPDNEFEVATANAFMDYMLDEFLGKYPELLAPIYLPANSPERAAELIDRVGSEKGIIGAMVTAHRKTLAGDDSWLPIYESVKKKNIPICFHASDSYIPPYTGFKSILPFYTLSFPFNLILQLTSIITTGIPERFPGIKFAFIEGGVTWIPWIMDRLDSVYLSMRSEAPLLKKLPSEYMKEFYYSSQPLEHPQKRSNIEHAFNSFNAGTQLMYASDYPHFDFDVPSVIYDLPFLSTEEKKNILGENARKLFRIS